MEISYQTNEIITRIKNKIDLLLFDSNKFFDFITKYKIFLSGSLLLQTIKDVEYDSFDIDLFVMGEENKELLSELKSICITELNTSIKFNQLLIKKNDYSSLELNSIVNCKGEYKSDKLESIQIIFIDETKYENVEKYIDLFDLDICANYYDGNNLFIKNLEGIINNIGTFNAQQKIGSRLISKRTEKRIIKYYARDFNIKLLLDECYDIYITDTNIYTNNDFHNNILLTSKHILIIYTKPDGTFLNQYANYNKLSNNLEKIIIYSYKYDEDISNLPINLKKITIYNSAHFNVLDGDAIEKFNNLTKTDNDKIKSKVPFGCEFYLNDLLM